MSGQKLNFNRFYQALLDIKEWSNKPEDSESRSDLEQFLYANARYWAMLGLNDYISGTLLENNIEEGDDGWEDRPRGDDQVIEDVKYDKGVSLIDFMGGCIVVNKNHHNLCEEASSKFDKELAVVNLIFDNLIEEVVIELLDEYSFDVDICVESYRNNQQTEEL